MPYVDMQATSGVNELTAGAYLEGDKTHPTVFGGVQMIGRNIVGALRRFY